MTVKEISQVADLSSPALALVQENSTHSDYLDSLEKKELYKDAIRFLAFKMEVNAGVKWGCKCIRELQPPEKKSEKDEPLEASEQWVKTPGDPTRWAAKEAAGKPNVRGASKMLAMAVFFSGGSIAPPQAPETPPPPNLAQKMIASSVDVNVLSHEPAKATERYKRSLALAKEAEQPAKA